MTTTETLTWLTEAHLECVRKYRCSIEQEIAHTLRIFGGKLRDDVKRVLKQSIKEIEIPVYPTPPCQETVSSLWDKCPKPNFIKIRAEYLEMIDSL